MTCFRIGNYPTCGWIFENSNEQCLVSIRASDGYTYIKGALTVVGTLSLSAGQTISSTNTLEFGYGVAGKENTAGKIGYQSFSSDSLDSWCWNYCRE